MLPELRRMALGEDLDPIPAAHRFAIDHAFQRKMEWVADYGGEDRLTSMELALLDSAERLEMQEALYCAMALQVDPDRALTVVRECHQRATGAAQAKLRLFALLGTKRRNAPIKLLRATKNDPNGR
jgi:hypothetical protein